MSKSKVRKAGVNSAPEKKVRCAAPSARHHARFPTARPFKGISPNAPAMALSEKIKELIRLAQEQGYLTYGDISDALPVNITEPKQLDEIINKLRSLDIEIMDQAEVDRGKTGESDEDDSSRLDALDDPVRMYLKQMGQVSSRK